MSSTMNNTSNLNILIPDVRAIYVGSGYRQKASYLQLPKEYSDCLKQDVQNGAKIYNPLLSYFNNKSSNYSIIMAPSLEDGFRAVTYLACENLNQDFVDINLYDNTITEEQLLEYDYDEIEELLYDPNVDDEDDDDTSYSTNSFEENPFKVPLVDMSSLWSINQPVFNSFGGFSQEVNSPSLVRKIWWENCTEESICIYLNSYSGCDFLWADGVLSDTYIEALKRFGTNKHVYILIASDDVPEEDISITKCMLEFTANIYKITPSKQELTEYYQKLLLEFANKYEHTFADSLDLQLLTEKLSKINTDSPCQIFEKIMLYFSHKGVKEEISLSDLNELGLTKLINSVNASVCTDKMNDELFGMEEVKKNINNISKMLKYNILRQKRGLETSGYHNVHLFIGAPGTAKTTVAKYMAALMQEEGLLKGNRFISISGAQLKAPYLGQTAHKIHALFQDYDAIIIDEAYSLTTDKTDQDSYAKEALAQLAIELEDHATDKLIIFAGYGGKNVSKANNRMYDFLEANPGIKSRINSTIVFDSYTPDEMVHIIHHIVNKNGMIMNDANDSLIKNYFVNRCNSQDFGNGREARSFVELLQRCIAERVMSQNPDTITNKQLNQVLKNDIVLTITKLKEMNAQQIGQNSIQLGF